MGIAQVVAHEAGESNLCREGSDTFPNNFGEDLLLEEERVNICVVVTKCDKHAACIYRCCTLTMATLSG